MRLSNLLSRKPSGVIPILASSILILGAGAALAQPNEDCLMCHEDADLTAERGGREISAFVDPEVYARSVHGDLDCIFCHEDLSGVELPHEDDTQPVDCGNCHDDAVGEYRQSLHARAGTVCSSCHGKHDIRPAGARSPGCENCHTRQAREHGSSLHGQAERRGDPLAPGCSDCHGSHRVLPASDSNSPIAVMNIPILCGGCHQEGAEVAQTREIHQDNILQNYSMSIHGEGLYRQGLTVTAVCTSCHTSHRILAHTDPNSSINRDNVGQTCEQCHGQIETVHRAVIEGHLWQTAPELIPVCVDCHSPHKIRNVLYPAGMANQDCLRCHGQEDLTLERDGEIVSIYVDEIVYAASKHAENACAQCHTEVNPSHERPCDTVEAKVDCGICHAEVLDLYRNSTHGRLFAEGDPDAPACVDCHDLLQHDVHAVQGKEIPTAPTFTRNIPNLCAKCHRAGERAAVRIEAAVPDLVQSYRDSIHGKGLIESGLVVTATCADCHSAHGGLPPADEESSVHHDNVSATCGTCHQGIAETFRTSIHWPTEEDDQEQEKPSCNTCHSSHQISRSDRTDFRFQMMSQCGQCHEDEAETFFDTFHGKVSRLGSAGAAKCYDCHGTHGILPSADPNSALSRDNVVETCGQCHEGSHRQFAGYLTHATHHNREKYPWLFWAFWGMTALLVGTLSFALLHTLAWLLRLFLSRDEWRAHKALVKADDGPLFQRFTRFNRILHLGMLVSFFTLALTGMALKFSYMGWAQGFAFVLGGFDVTGVLHRLGAIILFVVFFLHLWKVRQRKHAEGLSWKQVLTGPDTILPHVRDGKHVVQSIRWFFGMGKRPNYHRYTYWEKFDYFAVFWGVLIIGSTGLMLWFPEFFTRFIPGQFLNVATIIHSDEALLAVGFIFTIHFFNTHFRPDKFPMDPVIFTGRITVDELKYDKPGEYEHLVETGQLEKHLVKPHNKAFDRGIQIFAFVALATGLTLIALIIYAMLFGYR